MLPSSSWTTHSPELCTGAASSLPRWERLCRTWTAPNPPRSRCARRNSRQLGRHFGDLLGRPVAHEAASDSYVLGISNGGPHLRGAVRSDNHLSAKAGRGATEHAEYTGPHLAGYLE